MLLPANQGGPHTVLGEHGGASGGQLPGLGGAERSCAQHRGNEAFQAHGEQDCVESLNDLILIASEGKFSRH